MHEVNAYRDVASPPPAVHLTAGNDSRTAGRIFLNIRHLSKKGWYTELGLVCITVKYFLMSSCIVVSCRVTLATCYVCGPGWWSDCMRYTSCMPTMATSSVSGVLRKGKWEMGCRYFVVCSFTECMKWMYNGNDWTRGRPLMTLPTLLSYFRSGLTHSSGR